MAKSLTECFSRRSFLIVQGPTQGGAGFASGELMDFDAERRIWSTRGGTGFASGTLRLELIGGSALAKPVAPLGWS